MTGFDSRERQNMVIFCLLYIAPIRPLGPTEVCIKLVPGALSLEGGKRLKLTTHLHLVPSSRTMELYMHSPTPIYFMGVLLCYG
jgi:hypothetical protein